MVELDWHLPDERVVRRGHGGLSGKLVPGAFPGGALGGGIRIPGGGGFPECVRHPFGGKAHAYSAAHHVGTDCDFYRAWISSRALQSISSFLSDGPALAGSVWAGIGDCAVVVCGIRTTFDGD